MSSRPPDATPYEVLGVGRSASEQELRRAYRRAMRRAHPDTGGSPAEFALVQQAWAQIGTAEGRARYERTHMASARETPHQTTAARARAGRSAYGSAESFGSPAAWPGRTEAPPRARSHGHPGGLSRERYLMGIREWVGLGATIADPYEAELVRSLPAHLQRLLSAALAEEETARTLSALGPSFTVWHDAAAPKGLEKIDHIVLGPAGLHAIVSCPAEGPVVLARGELSAEGLGGEEAPVRGLSRATRALGRSTGVRFTGTALVLPDDSLSEPVQLVERGRNAGAAVVRRTALLPYLRGRASAQGWNADAIFAVRSRLQERLHLL